MWNLRNSLTGESSHKYIVFNQCEERPREPQRVNSARIARLGPLNNVRKFCSHAIDRAPTRGSSHDSRLAEQSIGGHQPDVIQLN